MADTATATVPSDMSEKKKKRNIVGRNGLYPPKVYQTTHVYLVDNIDPNAPVTTGRKRSREDPHTHKCNEIRKFFKKYVKCEVNSVRFKQGARGREFFQYWHRELAMKTKDDLVIIWFHGGAGGMEKEYKWTLSQYPKIQVNAFELIKMVTKCPADGYLLLDCFFPTRWVHRFSKEAVGHNEISVRPELAKYPDGRIMEHDGDFTESIVEDLKDFVKGINDKYRWGKRKKMVSIPDVLAVDQAMYSNPLRHWLSRTKFGDTTQVKRFRFCPKRLRRDDKLEFLTVVIQGPPEDEMADVIRQLAEEQAKAAEMGDEGDGDAFDDEALGEMMDEEENNGDGDEDEEEEAGEGTGTGSGGTMVEAAGEEAASSAEDRGKEGSSSLFVNQDED